MFIENINKFLPKYKNIDKQYFVEILDFSNKNGFDLIKLEKDFLLTLILIKFGKKFPDLIFKGGTCLNKIYFPYFRLSEDLDFTINFKGGEKARETLLKKYKEYFVENLSKLGINIKKGRTSFDSYKLAIFTFEYKSIINDFFQTIRIDISIKGDLQLKSVIGEIKSLYIDNILEENLFGKHIINCIDLRESMAEKIRASLTRRIPAIRDFFDIWYIKNYSNFDFSEDIFKKLVDFKLREVNYKYSLEGKYQVLKKQIEINLVPVLSKEFSFNFDEIYNFILNFKK